MIRKYIRRALFQKLLSSVHHADDYEISQIISAVIQRYSHIYSDQQVMFLSLPLDDLTEQERIINSVIQTLHKDA